jgi:excisionase family DNA binding protein
MSLVVVDTTTLKALISEAVQEAISKRPRPEETYSAQEAANVLKVHLKTIYEMKEEIGFVQIGRRILFRRSDLDRYMKQNFLTP